MELTVLGSGTSVPHPKRSSSGFWLETSGGSLLLDCSPSVLLRMGQENVDWPNLDAIWISHFHLDHCGGLAPFLFATRGAWEVQQRRKPLRIFGAAGLRRLLNDFNDANNYKLLDQPFPVEIIEVENREKFEVLPGVDAVPFSTPHTEDSHAIHIRDGEKTLVFTSDTGFWETFATIARHVDLFVIESSFLRNKPVEIHLELPEAMFLIRKAEPKRAMLTHLYAEWDKVDFKQEIERFSPLCEVIEAVDGLKMVI